MRYFVNWAPELLYIDLMLLVFTTTTTTTVLRLSGFYLRLLEQETVSGSGISWAICKSAPRPRQITTPAPNHSGFYMPDTLPATQPTASKHWRHMVFTTTKF